MKRASYSTIEKRKSRRNTRGVYLGNFLAALIPVANFFIFMRLGAKNAQAAERRFFTGFIQLIISVALLALPIFAIYVYQYVQDITYNEDTSEVVAGLSYVGAALMLSVVHTRISLSLGTAFDTDY